MSLLVHNKMKFFHHTDASGVRTWRLYSYNQLVIPSPSYNYDNKVTSLHLSGDGCGCQWLTIIQLLLPRLTQLTYITLRKRKTNLVLSNPISQFVSSKHLLCSIGVLLQPLILLESHIRIELGVMRRAIERQRQ